MDPAKNFGKKVEGQAKSFLNKIGFGDKTLKIIFLVGIVLFGLSIFLFKFEILSSLTTDEVSRLNTVAHLKTFAQNPTDPIHGVLQWLSLKALPNHQILALRLPGAFLLASALALVSISLYLKFRNRYLPYTFALLATTSPWVILFAHQGFLQGIDTLVLIAIISCAYFLITRSDISIKWKKLALLKASLAVALLALQPFGPFIFVAIVLATIKSNKLKAFFATLEKKERLLLVLPLLLVPILTAALLITKAENWRLISGFSSVQDPVHLIKNFIYNTQSIFGLETAKGLSLGAGAPDYLLLGALALTVYEIFKRRVGRLELVAGLGISLVMSSFFNSATAIVLVITFTLSLLSLALANMIRIIDAAFPRNPYPRNIARSGMLLLICSLASLNIYTFLNATARANAPEKLNSISNLRKK